jgi:hypothetical protein
VGPEQYRAHQGHAAEKKYTYSGAMSISVSLNAQANKGFDGVKRKV